MILNHLIVLQNVFGAEVAVTLLLFKVDNKYWTVLKTCLDYLGYLYPHELKDVETDKNIKEFYIIPDNKGGKTIPNQDIKILDYDYNLDQKVEDNFLNKQF